MTQDRRYGTGERGPLPPEPAWEQVLERNAIERLKLEKSLAGILVNVMDDVPHCDFAAPAVVRRGDLTIAVATGGRSPALARRLRERLGDEFGPEWADVLAVLGDVRAETLPLLPDLGERAERWARVLDVEELAELVRDGRQTEAKERLRARLLARQAGGRVRSEVAAS